MGGKRRELGAGVNRKEKLMLMATSVERMMQLEEYATKHSAPLPPLLEELVAKTREEMGGLSAMLSGHLQGEFLQMLVRAVGARRVLEIGTFTGFSALMMAEALPEDGSLITCDFNPKAIEVARGFFARSPHGSKIELREGPALETVKTLEGPFDFAFIDADKENLTAYYEAVLPMLSAKGIISVDNVLWMGRVLDPQDESDRAIVAFNEHVTRDERVWNMLLPIRDGVMLIRRM
jgi:caffeoyl-CoA O-methyltransferase